MSIDWIFQKKNDAFQTLSFLSPVKGLHEKEANLSACSSLHKMNETSKQQQQEKKVLQNNLRVPLEQSFQLSFSNRMTAFSNEFISGDIKGLHNAICQS